MEDLSSLIRLKNLFVAHNQLSSLRDLVALHGHALESLDVSGNPLSSMQELFYISGLNVNP